MELIRVSFGQFILVDTYCSACQSVPYRARGATRAGESSVQNEGFLILHLLLLYIYIYIYICFFEHSKSIDAF